MAKQRVSIDDLEFARDWMGTYEPGPDDDNGSRAERIKQWLDDEITARRIAAGARQIAKDTGLSLGKAKVAVKDQLRKQAFQG